MFKVKPSENKTVSWWHQQRSDIDMDPPYQRRGKIWSVKDKAYLIDSILNDFDIPKLYLADFTYVKTPLNTKRKSYAVIDGKQRFEAIFDFFAGDLTLDPKFEFMADKSLKLGGLGYRDLLDHYPKIAGIFDNFNLSVATVITDEEEKINELFVRLNRSKPLTGAEIRNAMSGQVPKLIRSLVQHRFFQQCISFNTKRKQDDNAAAKLLLVEFRGRFVDTKKVNLDRFVEEEILAQSAGFERAAKRVERVLNSMAKIFTKRDPLLKAQGSLTVYYWFVREFRNDRRIREFLVNFDRDRRANSKIAKARGRRVDEELLQFDVLNRSTNDQGSLSGRFSILAKRFEAFRAPKD